MSYGSAVLPNASHLYAVVEFPNEGSCQVIPTSWLIKDNTFCIYPKVDSFRMTRLVRDRILPPKSDRTDNYVGKDVWVEHCVRILTYTDSYEKGRQKAATSEYTSNVEFEDNQDRLRKRARNQNIHYDISTDDEKAQISPKKRRNRKVNFRTSNPNRKQVHPKQFNNDNRDVQPLILPPNQPLIGSLTNPTSIAQAAIPRVSCNTSSFTLAPGSGRVSPISPLRPSHTLTHEQAPDPSPSATLANRTKTQPSTGNRLDIPFSHSRQQALYNCCDFNSPICFVKKCREIYGIKFIVYNVHSLIHLADDALLFGSLDNCSAFAFENFMQILKGNIRKNYQQLAQVAERYHERSAYKEYKVNLDGFVSNASLGSKKYVYNGVAFTNSLGNNCFLTKNGSYVVIKDILFDNNDKVLFICKVLDVESLKMYPCDSLKVGICNASYGISELELRHADLLRKCVMLPRIDGRFVCFPYTSDL